MKVRYVNWYADEWLAGTAELDATERGVYATVVNLIYSRGGPVRNDRDLVRLCGVHGNAFNRIMERLLDLGKLIENDGHLTNKRCENELEIANNRHAKALKNGQKGGRPSKQNNEIAEPEGFAGEKLSITKELKNLRTKEQSISSDRKRSDATDRFLEFYQVFPKHEARRAAERAWKAACKRAPPETIIAGAERYAELMADVEKRFIKQPATWLNADCWADGEEDGRRREHVEVSDEEREAALQQLLKEREGERLYVAYDAGEVGVAR